MPIPYKTDEIEFWFARDLQRLFGYSKWENFLKVIDKAEIVCGKAGIETKDNFAKTTSPAPLDPAPLEGRGKPGPSRRAGQALQFCKQSGAGEGTR